MFLSYKDKPAFKVSVHLVTWFLLMFLPYLLSYGQSFDLLRLMKYNWVPMVFYAIIFYFNYFYLIKNFLFNKRLVLYYSINFAIILIFIYVHIEIRELLNMISVTQPNSVLNKIPPPPIKLFIYKDAIAMIIPVIIAFAIKTTEKWAKIEASKKERENEMLNWELEHLKYQLQPHFFFNSLNTIYALIERSPDTAKETVHNLSKLMRYLLYDSDSSKSNLNDEIQFMQQYLNLMKLRISEKTFVTANFPSFVDELKITPLLFISLIENAFKHGVSSIEKSEIYFKLEVDQNILRFIAKNTNFPKNEQDKSGSGIGLKNLRKRLELSYPKSYNFNTKIENNYYVALLEITIF